MTSTSGDPTLIAKKASFIQHSLPGLDPGRYRITIQQTLATPEGTDITAGGLPPLTRTFGVAGPRFALSQNAVHSVFPPANSVGEFSDSFAHVVLESEKLPWLRSPYGPLDEPPPGVRSYTNDKGVEVSYDEDRPAWLGVLLVSPSDLDQQDPSRLVVQGTVLDLIPGSLTSATASGTPVAGGLPANAYSVFSYLLEPAYAEDAAKPVDPGVGQATTDAVRYLDVPWALFNAIAPSLDDLKMMAHVRAVRMDSKPMTPHETVDPERRYALVIGNRLPESLPAAPPGNGQEPQPAAGANVAFLVSFESLEYALRGHAAGSYYDAQIATRADGVVRLVVLYEWRFTSQSDTSFEFETLLKSLNGRDGSADNAAADLADPMLRMPSPPVFAGGDERQAIVQQMLESGYTPHRHVTRVASAASPEPVATVSWYRGPLIPFDAFVPAVAFVSTSGPDAGEPLIFAADQLLRFDPNAGMYDVSYAAAWQLGQLLALDDKEFSVALSRWKHQAALQLRSIGEREGLESLYVDRVSLLRRLSDRSRRG